MAAGDGTVVRGSAVPERAACSKVDPPRQVLEKVFRVAFPNDPHQILAWFQSWASDQENGRLFIEAFSRNFSDIMSALRQLQPPMDIDRLWDVLYALQNRNDDGRGERLAKRIEDAFFPSDGTVTKISGPDAEGCFDFATYAPLPGKYVDHKRVCSSLLVSRGASKNSTDVERKSLISDVVSLLRQEAELSEEDIWKFAQWPSLPYEERKRLLLVVAKKASNVASAVAEVLDEEELAMGLLFCNGYNIESNVIRFMGEYDDVDVRRLHHYPQIAQEEILRAIAREDQARAQEIQAAIEAANN